jgi:hypothetical protein
MMREYSDYEGQAIIRGERGGNSIVTEESSMSGAESLVHTLVASGVDACFTNPGTSEMHFV